ncbi:hypothetical protein Leryth_012307 [Lithospermum erythrorhizon]|nr:hypothetical protein Leryth_012307 [Lithospermum erythrorhizon]
MRKLVSSTLYGKMTRKQCKKWRVNCQLLNSSGETSPQFILKYLPLHGNHCLANFIDDYCSREYAPISSNQTADDDRFVVHQTDVSNVTLTPPELETTKHQIFANGAKNTCLYKSGCGSLTCQCFLSFSCLRTITAIASCAKVGIASYATLEGLVANFLSGSVEDHILCSLTSLIEGKASGHDSTNFLNLIGVPSFPHNIFPGCIRHPNVTPVLGILKTSSHINFVLPKAPHTLQSILHYSPGALKSDWHVRFLMYQLLSDERQSICFQAHSRHKNRHPLAGLANCADDCFSRVLFSDLNISQTIDFTSSFNSWWKGDLSNFEYLLILNRMAGRRWGDHTFYIVMPWVIDFSVKPDENSDVGWRDLSKSKWRLAKGDEQLDFTYSTSEIPHHVSDECLSELAVCSYKARRLPLSVLRMAVRSVYEPNEYPSSMHRLYQWTPDECIPEFYCDPRIFYSLHPGMSDLAVPFWAKSPEEFIKFHRDALESNKASSMIHHWIDITFGYKMSGQAAIDAKNVMLPPSASTDPRSVGRFQLFSKPHPPRQVSFSRCGNTSANDLPKGNESFSECGMPFEISYIDDIIEAAEFCEHALHLSPCFDVPPSDEFSKEDEHSCKNLKDLISQKPQMIDLNYLLKSIEVDNESSLGYQELILWRQKSHLSQISSVDTANDIFAFGCILAEVHLNRPLFNPISYAAFMDSGTLPGSILELPPPTQIIVEACIEKDWRRRPSTNYLLESPYFSRSVKSSYLFLAPLQLLARHESHLRYAATFAKLGALKEMGAFAAEMCAPLCLPLVLSPSSDSEAELALIVLIEFLNCLNLTAVKTILMPVIQKILQTAGHSRLKVSLLQGSFMQEIWHRVGKQAYLELIHPYVLSNLYVTPHKSSASAASVLLIGSSEELGVPVTIHQTILPIVHYFGKGICDDGIYVLVRIGCNFGENFIVKHILPLIQLVVQSCVASSFSSKTEASQSWSTIALMDCLKALHGFVAFLPRETIVEELIEGKNCLYVQLLMQTKIGMPVLQVAATNLAAICERIGPDLTALHIVPKLKKFFNEFAFSQEENSVSGTHDRSVRSSRLTVDEENYIKIRRDLVFFLYPFFASVLGIEKLRQCCTTWLLLEQFLLRCYHWKWEHMEESSRSGEENATVRKASLSDSSISDYAPTKMFLNEAGWSMPKSQGHRVPRNFISSRTSSDHQVIRSSVGIHEPWYWFPSQATSWEEPDYLGRSASLKDELPWKIRASVINSARGHHGSIRSIAICQDENTVFTAGVGQGYKGTIQKWQLSTADCVSAYDGHEEVVNDICLLTSSGRIASCDGTVHIWNSQNGKLISLFAECSANSEQHASLSSSSTKMNTDQGSMLLYNTSSSGILNTAFDESLYTTMHYLESVDMLLVGTGSGALRFIDVSQDRKLHLWRSGSMSSLISSICSSSSTRVKPDGTASFPSWIATGLSSGFCKLFDLRSGDIIASWQAHDGYLTKLAAPEEHLLVSSSLDRTLRVWDLRRSWTSQSMIFRGHNDGISGFSVWGRDVISISKTKIGLSSLARSADGDGQCIVAPQYLYTSDSDSRNMSVLSSISILPFSRLFLLGTEDGHMKICC